MPLLAVAFLVVVLRVAVFRVVFLAVGFLVERLEFISTILFEKKKVMTATQNALKVLSIINQSVDEENELQSKIGSDIWFKRCSVNLLIGRRGSGKTYNALREAVKLNWVSNYGGFERLLFVSDKATDPTFERLKTVIPFPIKVVPYAEAIENIELIEQNAAVEKTPSHSIVILDDAQDILVKRTENNKQLYRKLFQNRQARISYFITLQDGKGISSEMKQNADSFWLFGGFTKMKFDYIMNSIPHESDNRLLWNIYVNLSRNQAMIFTSETDGTTLTVLTK